MHIHSFRSSVSRFLSLSAILFAAGACCVNASAQDDPPELEVSFEILVQSVPGELVVDSSSISYDLNDRGDVAGVASISPHGSAFEAVFLYTEEDGYQTITEYGQFLSPQDIHLNNHREIAFNGNQNEGAMNPYFYDGNTFKDIGTLGVWGDGLSDLNDAGYIVGGSDNSIAWYYDPVLDMQIDIGQTNPDARSRGLRAINESNVMVGFEENPDDPSSWGVTRYTEEDGLEYLGNYGFTTANPVTINNNDDVLIHFVDGWSRFGILDSEDTLEMLPQERSHSLFDMNDDRWVVGTTEDDLAMLWIDEFGVIDLNEYTPDWFQENPGNYLQQAFRVNNNGQIIGLGFYEQYRMLWTMQVDIVPSPSIGFIVLLGLVCTLGRRQFS